MIDVWNKTKRCFRRVTPSNKSEESNLTPLDLRDLNKCFEMNEEEKDENDGEMNEIAKTIK